MEDSKEKVYYAIRARPSQNNHMEHIVCYFSSLENAQKHYVKTSYDYDDSCEWYYSIEIVTDESKVNFSSIDKPPEYYPYSGW